MQHAVRAHEDEHFVEVLQRDELLQKLRDEQRVGCFRFLLLLLLIGCIIDRHAGLGCRRGSCSGLDCVRH